MGLYSKSHEKRNSPTEQPLLSLDFGDMMKGGGQSSPQPASSTSSSVSNTPPTTPLTPGTPLSGPGTPLTPSGSASLASLLPLGPPTTPSYPGPYRHRLPSFTESDSQSSTRDVLSDDAASQSDSQSDVASVGSSTAEWVNFDITPLVKKELKDAIITRRKTKGLPDVKVDFTPRSPDKLTPEEEERRRLQKERNRDAASKCRSKKRNAVGRLVEEAQQLETENTKLREEMKALESERSQLQFLLDMHSPECIQQKASSSPLEANTSSRIQYTDSTCGSVPPLIHSTSSEVITHNLPMSRESVTVRANAPTPKAGSPSPYGSSCFPPTPSTTHSLSCTEPSTPATPTSFMDAPVFPTMSSSMIPMGTVADPIFQDTSASVLPIASLANSSACTLTDGFSFSDIADFPPGAPPTPELFDDHDDPLSESFVKRYLGMDPFVSTDLFLPTIADNTAVPGNTQMSSVQGSGEIRPSAERPMSTEGYTELAQPLLENQLRLQTSAQIQSEKINSHSRAEDPPPDTPVTLSLSALLGISFEGTDETMVDASSFSVSSHSAIDL